MNQSTYTREFSQLINKYPPVIKNQLLELFSTVISTIDDTNLISIVLIGSTARNEISYILKENKIDIYSDYEFVIVVNNKLSNKEKILLKNKFVSLEKKWNIKSPLFHIDYGVSSYYKFKLTPPTLWAYEVKKKGVLVYGKDVRNNITKITIDNLDFGNLNELIIVRLWNSIIHTNNGFVLEQNNDYENFIIKFYYARNILDVLTILLPNHGVLIPGYKKRTEYFCNNFKKKLWSNLKHGIIKAMQLKLAPYSSKSISLNLMQETFIQGYITLLNDLVDGNSQNHKEIEELKPLIKNSKIFRERPIRFLRRKYIEYKLWKNYYNKSIISIRLFKNDLLRINLLYYLLYMNISILDKSKSEKIYFLKKAIKYWNAISFVNSIDYDDDISFEENWINVREKSVDFMMIWFYERMDVEKQDILNKFKWSE